MMTNVNFHSPAMRGAITIEYLIVSVLLMLPIWYFVVGGSGGWSDPDKDGNAGNLTRTNVSSELYPYSAVKVLDQRQHDFANKINQP